MRNLGRRSRPTRQQQAYEDSSTHNANDYTLFPRLLKTTAVEGLW